MYFQFTQINEAMKQKNTLFALLFVSFGFFSRAQTVTSARFRISEHNKGPVSIELVLDDSILVGINQDGRIDYAESIDGKPTDYHAQPLSNQNNWKQNGNIQGFTVRYYDNFDIHDPKDKLKSIGNIQFKYYNTFDIHDQPGSLKSIGDIKLTYYNTFDIHDPQGKIKSVGNVNIKYFNKFDTGERFGRIKSIEGNTRKLSVVTGRYQD